MPMPTLLVSLGMILRRYFSFILISMGKSQRSMNMNAMTNSGYAYIEFSTIFTVKTMSKLSPAMQARLDKWRMNPVPVKKLIEKKQSPGNFVARRRDHCDEHEAFNEMKNNGK